MASESLPLPQLGPVFPELGAGIRSGARRALREDHFFARVSNLIQTGALVCRQLKGAYPLKGAYHVSFRHSFIRRHYRHGTC
jgi:hypothetical protein